VCVLAPSGVRLAAAGPLCSLRSERGHSHAESAQVSPVRFESRVGLVNVTASVADVRTVSCPESHQRGFADQDDKPERSRSFNERSAGVGIAIDERQHAGQVQRGAKRLDRFLGQLLDPTTSFLYRFDDGCSWSAG
jgi:hypothetical protein